MEKHNHIDNNINSDNEDNNINIGDNLLSLDNSAWDDSALIEAWEDHCKLYKESHTNNKNNVPTSIVNSSAAANKESIYNPLTKYKSYISMLHANRSAEGSLANLRYKARS